MAVETIKAPKLIAGAHPAARFGGSAASRVATPATNNRAHLAPWRTPLARALQEQGSNR